MTVRFLRTTALVALGLLASACKQPAVTNGAPAANQAAAASAPPAASPTAPPAAEAQGGYQLALVPGSAQWGQDAVRMNTTTGQTNLSAGAAAFIVVADPTPIPAGNYRLYSWTTFDNGATTREWDVYRLDLQSGRLWDLNYDGQTTASWSEIVVGPPAAAQPPAAPPPITPPPTTPPPIGQ